MNILETTLNEITKDKVIEAGENVEKAGEIAFDILSIGDFIANNIWIIPIILICASVLTAIIKRRRRK